MLKTIKISVVCPISNREETLYYHIFKIGQECQIMPNGCDNSNGSQACKNCIAKHLKNAQDNLSILLNGNLFFHEPK